MQLSKAVSRSGVAVRHVRPACVANVRVRATPSNETNAPGAGPTGEVPPAPASPIAQPPVSAAPPSPVAQAKALPSFQDVMAFGGKAPEIVNGRLAMLGFVAAVGAELSTGESVLRQLAEQPTAIVAAFVVFIFASLVPAFKGANSEAFGPLTPTAELINGRGAMIGFAALLAIEAVKGSALF